MAFEIVLGRSHGFIVQLALSEDCLEVIPESFYDPPEGQTIKIQRSCILAAIPTYESDGSHDVFHVRFSESSSVNTQEPDLSKAFLDILPVEPLHPPSLPGHLSTTIPMWLERHRQDDNVMQNLHVIVSTGSGSGLAATVYNNLVKPLLNHLDIPHQLHMTASVTSITDITAAKLLPAALNGIPQTIILLSGDGGPIDLVNSLSMDWASSIDSGIEFMPPAVALIPTGTANALAFSSGITSTNDHTYGLKTLMNGIKRRLPTLTASFSPGARLVTNEGQERIPVPSISPFTNQPTIKGAVVFSWCMHASLVSLSDTTDMRKHGSERFKMAAGELLHPADGTPTHIYQGKVSVLRPGNRQWVELGSKKGYYYLLATLVSNLEATFRISPKSTPMDGKMYVVSIEAEALQKKAGDESVAQELMRMMMLAYQDGKHIEEDSVHYEEIEGIRIEFEGGSGTVEHPKMSGLFRQICVDGKIIEVEVGGRAEVRLDKSEKSIVDLIVSA